MAFSIHFLLETGTDVQFEVSTSLEDFQHPAPRHCSLTAWVAKPNFTFGQNQYINTSIHILKALSGIVCLSICQVFLAQVYSGPTIQLQLRFQGRLSQSREQVGSLTHPKFSVCKKHSRGTYTALHWHKMQGFIAVASKTQIFACKSQKSRRRNKKMQNKEVVKGHIYIKLKKIPCFGANQLPGLSGTPQSAEEGVK